MASRLVWIPVLALCFCNFTFAQNQELEEEHLKSLLSTFSKIESAHAETTRIVREKQQTIIQQKLAKQLAAYDELNQQAKAAKTEFEVERLAYKLSKLKAEIKRQRYELTRAELQLRRMRSQSTAEPAKKKTPAQVASDIVEALKGIGYENIKVEDVQKLLEASNATAKSPK